MFDKVCCRADGKVSHCGDPQDSYDNIMQGDSGHLPAAWPYEHHARKRASGLDASFCMAHPALPAPLNRQSETCLQEPFYTKSSMGCCARAQLQVHVEIVQVMTIRSSILV